MISTRMTSLPFFPATRLGLTMTICLPFMTEMVFGLATNVRIDCARLGTMAFAILGIFEQPQLAAQLKRVRSLFIPSIKFAKDYSGKSRWPRFKAGMVLMSTRTAISIFSWGERHANPLGPCYSGAPTPRIARSSRSLRSAPFDQTAKNSAAGEKLILSAPRVLCGFVCASALICAFQNRPCRA
jgi:hypothetical protein